MDFFHTHISKEAVKKVRETLDTTFISEGKKVLEFEQVLSSSLGLVNPVAVNSGTSALHLALVIAGVGEGDEVILPAQTFVASGLAILMQRAKPVFSDIRSDTGNIDPALIKQKISKRTKAIMPVHWGGYPCDMDEIVDIAREYNLVVIEDAAHALGAIYKGKPIGSISPLTCFSFQAIKHLTTGDGGVLCCLEENDASKAKRLRWFGIDRVSSKPSILGEREFDITEVGFKYHLNDYSAALGLANLEDIDFVLKRRRDIAGLYYNQLKNISGLKLLNYQDDRQGSFWLFTVLVENREDFIRKLKSHDIPTSVVHLRIDRYSVFGGTTQDLEGQEYFNKHQVSIPIHSGLTNLDVQKIIKVIKQGW